MIQVGGTCFVGVVWVWTEHVMPSPNYLHGSSLNEEILRVTTFIIQTMFIWIETGSHWHTQEKVLHTNAIAVEAMSCFPYPTMHLSTTHAHERNTQHFCPRALKIMKRTPTTERLWLAVTWKWEESSPINSQSSQPIFPLSWAIEHNRPRRESISMSHKLDDRSKQLGFEEHRLLIEMWLLLTAEANQGDDKCHIVQRNGNSSGHHLWQRWERPTMRDQQNN